MIFDLCFHCSRSRSRSRSPSFLRTYFRPSQWRMSSDLARSCVDSVVSGSASLCTFPLMLILHHFIFGCWPSGVELPATRGYVDTVSGDLPHSTQYVSDKLLLSVPRMALSLSAKAFSVCAPSVWNSLSHNCRSAELFSTFKRNLKTELFDTAYSDCKHSA